MLKVFISYSTQDRATATRLYGDLGAAGAEVFQFGQTETVGKPSWEQVLAWINASDVFIVLLSKSALKSTPVNEEIEQANYSRINRKRPDKIIPAIIEQGVQPPLQIERFTTIELIPYDTGLNRLIGQLGLTRSSLGSKLTALTLPDPGNLLSEYLRKNPDPTPAKKWSAKAEKVLANYNALKPPEIGDDIRADHIDSVLAELSGNKKPPRLAKLDNLFLRAAAGHDSGTQPSLADKLLSYEPFTSAPNAPVLREGFLGIEWDPVLGASEYAVEESINSGFLLARQVYRGSQTNYLPKATLSSRRFYRVKAIAGPFEMDSAWSNVVEYPAPLGARLTKPIGKLTAPTLRAAGPKLEWSESSGASNYVLQSSATKSFEKAETIYEGTDKAYYLWSLNIPAGDRYFRVRAAATILFFDSPWSEVLYVAPWNYQDPFQQFKTK